MAAATSYGVEPLWRRALRSRASELKRLENCGASARLALWHILLRAGRDVSLVTIRNWPRRMQGQAYLWAVDYLNGRENVPPPWEGP